MQLHAVRVMFALAWAMAFAGCAGPNLSSGPAASIERFEVIARKPAYGGTPFGDVGPCEVVVAIAHVQVDLDPQTGTSPTSRRPRRPTAWCATAPTSASSFGR